MEFLCKNIDEWTKNKNTCFFLIFNLEPPKDDGGSEITKYIVELNDGKGMYCYEICWQMVNIYCC
jgi:hypothetical protein